MGSWQKSPAPAGTLQEATVGRVAMAAPRMLLPGRTDEGRGVGPLFVGLPSLCWTGSWGSFRHCTRGAPDSKPLCWLLGSQGPRHSTPPPTLPILAVPLQGAVSHPNGS